MAENTKIIEPRPISLSIDAILPIAQAMAEQLVSNGHSELGDAAEIANDIAKVWRSGMDGYQLAKALDERCYWDCDLSLAEDLDGFGRLVDAEIKKAQQAWSERNNIQPAYADGDRVKYLWGREPYIGRIAEICAYEVATYLIAPEKEMTNNGRHVVRFEDVQGISEALA